MNVKLHIEQLVLEGINLASHEHRHLQAAVEAELSQLLSTGGVSQELAGGMALPSLQAGDIQLGNGASAVTLGQQIAQAVYRGIGK